MYVARLNTDVHNFQSGGYRQLSDASIGGILPPAINNFAHLTTLWVASYIAYMLIEIRQLGAHLRDILEWPIGHPLVESFLRTKMVILCIIILVWLVQTIWLFHHSLPRSFDHSYGST